MTEPMSDERLAKVREHLAEVEMDMTFGDFCACDLLAEVDRLRARVTNAEANEEAYERLLADIETVLYKALPGAVAEDGLVTNMQSLGMRVERLRASLWTGLHAALADLDEAGVGLDRLTVAELTDMLASAIEQGGGGYGG